MPENPEDTDMFSEVLKFSSEDHQTHTEERKEGLSLTNERKV